MQDSSNVGSGIKRIQRKTTQLFGFAQTEEEFSNEEFTEEQI